MYDSIKKDYFTKGYSIIRNAIDESLALEMEEHVYWLSKKYPDIHPEAFHHDLLVNDPFIHHLLKSENLLDIAEKFIGSNIALFGAHYIAKKPLEGKAVGWHQDGSYWPLIPMDVISLWLAGTNSKANNGCMKIIPGTQNNKLIKQSDMIKEDMEKFVLGLAIHPDEINDSEAIDIELNPGDVSIHNPFLVHGSNPNNSKGWRIGLTLRYIPTSTFVNRKEWDCILLRGEPSKKINNKYVKQPFFKNNEHMKFKGFENYLK
jgi:ectoine hydroxylase-related dioxygenase (phytanoyl-CoA dioxygenase family)